MSTFSPSVEDEVDEVHDKGGTGQPEGQPGTDPCPPEHRVHSGEAVRGQVAGHPSPHRALEDGIAKHLEHH